MGYRSSIETSLKILETLMLHGAYAQYDLDEEVGKDYRTVLRHLQKLERAGLIRLVRRERAAKRGKQRKVYAVTLAGLLLYQACLIRGIPTYAYLAPSLEFADRFKDLLPLIFGKWRFFVSNGVDKVISEALTSFLRLHSIETLLEGFLKIWEVLPAYETERLLYKFGFDVRKWKEAQEGILQAVDELLERNINSYVLVTYPLESLSGEERKNFFGKITSDVEIRSWVVEQLEVTGQKFAAAAQAVQELKKMIMEQVLDTAKELIHQAVHEGKAPARVAVREKPTTDSPGV